MRIVTVVMTADPRRDSTLARRAYQLTRAYPRVGGRRVRAELLTLELGLTDARVDGLAPAVVTALPCRSSRLCLPGRIERVGERVATADVVHLVGHRAVLTVLGYRAACRLRVPYVLSPGGSLPAPRLARPLARAFDAAVGARMVRRAAAAVVASAAEASDLVVGGWAAPDVEVIPDGAEPGGLGGGRSPRGRYTWDDAAARYLELFARIARPAIPAPAGPPAPGPALGTPRASADEPARLTAADATDGGS
ncbi:MAG: hypothetical protein IRZ08_00425 [Frankia sp.]|nr:hypothetical protein [Frankia sp.]